MKLRKIEKEILEILNEGKEKRSGRYEGKADLRKVINDMGKYTDGQFNYAIRKLKDMALIRPLKGRGIYAITDRGKAKIRNEDEEEVKEYEKESPRWKETGFRKYSLYIDGNLNSTLSIGHLKDKNQFLVNLTNYQNHRASDHKYFDTLEEAEKFAEDYMENQEHQLSEIKDMKESTEKSIEKIKNRDQKKIDNLRKGKVREYEAFIEEMKGDPRNLEWGRKSLYMIQRMSDEEFMDEYYPEREVYEPKKNEKKELTEEEKKAMRYLARETGFLNTVKDY